MAEQISETWSIEDYTRYLSTGIRPASPELAQERLDGGDDGKCTPKPNKADIKAEKELQQNCENWLHTCRGYLRFTATNAERVAKGEHVAGWFGHLHKPKGNPFLPDLFIFNDICTRSLFVELKVRPVYQRGQREMIDNLVWTEVNTFEQFIDVVTAWEVK